jgi:hypothetical protein
MVGRRCWCPTCDITSQVAASISECYAALDLSGADVETVLVHTKCLAEGSLVAVPVWWSSPTRWRTTTCKRSLSGIVHGIRGSTYCTQSQLSYTRATYIWVIGDSLMRSVKVLSSKLTLKKSQFNSFIRLALNGYGPKALDRNSDENPIRSPLSY